VGKSCPRRPHRAMTGAGAKCPCFPEKTCVPLMARWHDDPSQTPPWGPLSSSERRSHAPVDGGQEVPRQRVPAAREGGEVVAEASAA
jgi:hypothetical protein